VFFGFIKIQQVLFFYSTKYFILNRFPAMVSAGNSFVYFAGMTFVVLSLIGKFPLRVLIFFIPQFLNLFLSLPQVKFPKKLNFISG